jgi:CBS domain containing-hemolysin-like protein
MPKTHNGRTVAGERIELRKMGGAFSEKLLVANAELLDGVTIGTRMTLAVDVVCIDEHYPAVDRAVEKIDESEVEHLLVFDPTDVVIIDRSKVAKAFKDQAANVQKAKDDARGQATVQESIGDKLEEAHLAGDHADGLVADCPLCSWEGEVEAAEQTTDPAD